MKKSVPITILICLVFSIHCNQTKQKEIKEIVLNPKDKFVNIEFTKEKSIVVSGISYCRLLMDAKGFTGLSPNLSVIRSSYISVVQNRFNFYF